MVALLFLNGNPPLKSTLESIEFSKYFVVCADGAYNYLAPYCIPDILVGDFDSLELKEVNAKKIIRLKPEKDFTDGHIAMLQLIEQCAKIPEHFPQKKEPYKEIGQNRQNFEYCTKKTEQCQVRIFIYGALGGDPDHELSNYSLLALSALHGIESVILSEKFNIYFAQNDFTCSSAKGKRVSLVPFTDCLHILGTRGLKYPISDEIYGKLHIKGISNVATADEIGYNLKSGAALVFVEN